MTSKKLISETVYQENILGADNLSDPSRFKKSYVEFDPNGNQIKEITWDSRGEVEQRLMSYYSDDGKLIKQEVFLAGEELTEEHTFTYNSEGLLHDEVISYSESGIEQIRHEYDEHGHLLRKVYHDEEGMIESMEEWQFDGERLIGEKRTEDGEVVYEHRWEYDGERLTAETINEEFVELKIVYEDGNPGIRKQIRNGVLISTQSTHFDAEGRPTRIEETNVRGARSISVEYDANGNETLRQETGPDGNILQRVQFTRNDAGEVMETEIEANTKGIGIDRHYKFIYENIYQE